MPNITLNRATVIQGPALVLNENQTFYSAGDITVTPVKTLFDIPTSILGKQTDQRLKDAYYKVSFKHSGEVTSALLAIKFPWGSMNVGQSISGTVDSPLRIISLNDIVDNFTTFRNAAVTKSPKLMLKSSATTDDMIEFTCLGANGVPFNAANRFYYQSTRAISGAITATSNANPDVLTSEAHGLYPNDPITIANVKGDTAVNGLRYVLAVLTANTFTVSATPGGAAIAGNAAFSGAGTWKLGWPLQVQNIVTSAYLGSYATTIPTATVAGTSNANPDLVTTTAAHGFVVGDTVEGSGAQGDTAINGTFLIATVPTAEEFTLTTLAGAPVAGNGAWTEGGTFTRANPLDAFETEDGYEIDFDVTLTPKKTNGLGTYDMLFSSLTVKVKGKPVGPTLQQMQAAINLQGANVNIGQSMAAEGQNLNISGNGLYFQLTQAAITANPTQYSAEKFRIDDVQWVATRQYAGYVPQPLYTVSTTPID